MRREDGALETRVVGGLDVLGQEPAAAGGGDDAAAVQLGRDLLRGEFSRAAAFVAVAALVQIAAAAVVFTVYSQHPLPAAMLCYLAEGSPLLPRHCPHEGLCQSTGMPSSPARLSRS